MQSDTGVLIAIEGIDGAGKKTQCDLLERRLESAGYSIAYFDFPQYDQTSSYFVKRYLNGEYGPLSDIGPYRASQFYAIDRYDAADKIRAAVDTGKIVIINRFVGSNMAHQGAKIASAEERRGYYIWLDNLEYEIYKLPRPTISFVLETTVATTQALIEARSKQNGKSSKRELHEADTEYMAKVAAVYDELTRLFPRDFQAIDCLRGGELLDPQTINDLLWGKIEPLLPIVQAATETEETQPKLTSKPESQPKQLTDSASVSVLAATGRGGSSQPARVITPLVTEQWVYVPPQFTPEVRDQYLTIMGQLRSAYDTIHTRTSEHLRKTNPSLTSEQIETSAQTTLQYILPAATLVSAPAGQIDQQEEALVSGAKADSAIRSLAESALPGNHTGQGEAVLLTSYWPRNELDLVPEILYEFSDQPLEVIQNEVAKWPYEKKAAALRSYAAEHLEPESPPGLLDHTHYTWDLVSDLVTFRDLARRGINLERQVLSPRLGYDVPDVIEQTGLTDDFERCFDLSLQLYSQLQAADYTIEAQYATLLGHRLRWKASWSPRGMYDILRDRGPIIETAESMYQKLSEVHPIIAETMDFVVSS